jgi:putative RecB family exonuclease
VHAILEELYGVPTADRKLETAISLIGPAWDRLTQMEPERVDGIDSETRVRLFSEARDLVTAYYRLEDPTRFDPQSREERIEAELSDGTALRGYVDRIDVAGTGELRVVDYKTGRSPSAVRTLSEAKALFQMKFYAVVLLRARNVLASRLRLIYLADGQILDYAPELDELLRFEKTLIAIWTAIKSAGASGDFRPNPTRLCEWCRHQSHCPSRGGILPPYPGWPERPHGEPAA